MTHLQFTGVGAALLVTSSFCLLACSSTTDQKAPMTGNSAETNLAASAGAGGGALNGNQASVNGTSAGGGTTSSATGGASSTAPAGGNGTTANAGTTAGVGMPAVGGPGASNGGTSSVEENSQAGGSGGAMGSMMANDSSAGSGGMMANGGAAGAEEMADAGTTDDTDQMFSRSPGCDSQGEPLAEGVHTFNLDGNNRRYTVRLPQNYDPTRAWPLVLALHPNGGDVGYWDGTSGSRNIRGYLKEDAVIIIAEAIGGNWRDYNAPESQWPDRVELELNYFDQVIGEVNDQLCIDEKAIFAMGFSGGGSFSGVLGCRRTDIRAFAAGGSVIYFDPETCIGNAAAWIVLSEGDDTDDRRAYLNYFAERAGCDDANFQGPTCHEYQGCAPESPVIFCQYPGGHDWPSFGVEDAWTFFSQFIFSATKQ